jgi:hypothetical protein
VIDLLNVEDPLAAWHAALADADAIEDPYKRWDALDGLEELLPRSELRAAARARHLQVPEAPEGDDTTSHRCTETERLFAHRWHLRLARQQQHRRRLATMAFYSGRDVALGAATLDEVTRRLDSTATAVDDELAQYGPVRLLEHDEAKRIIAFAFGEGARGAHNPRRRR